MNEVNAAPPPYPPQQAAAQSDRFPGFAKGFIITDLVFCALRGIIGVMAIVGLFILKDKGPLFLAYTEVISNFAILFLGLPANILLLNKKLLGMKFAYMSIFFTVINLISGCIGVFYKAAEYTNAAQKIGATVGGTVTILIRIAIIVLYIIAIKQAYDYLSARNDNDPYQSFE